jgi:hypothetical protein
MYIVANHLRNQEFLLGFKKYGFYTTKRSAPLSLISYYLITKYFLLFPRKVQEKSSFLDMVIIKEFDMKNSEYIPLYDDID